MSQQINLLDPMFRPRRVALSAVRVALSLCGLLLLLVAVHAYQRDRVTHLTREQQALREKVEAYRQSVDKMKKTAAGASRPALEAEIARLQAELKSQQDNVRILQSGAIGDRNGFSEYLRAFSRQALDGLWLTGFTITGGGGDIVLHGRVMDAALLPDYIQRLSSEDVLKGRSFATLEMKRPTLPANGKERGATTRPAPYLEFRLAGSEQGEDGRALQRNGRTP